jgi:hypothetical protein
MLLPLRVDGGERVLPLPDEDGPGGDGDRGCDQQGPEDPRDTACARMPRAQAWRGEVGARCLAGVAGAAQSETSDEQRDDNGRSERKVHARERQLSARRRRPRMVGGKNP